MEDGFILQPSPKFASIVANVGAHLCHFEFCSGNAKNRSNQTRMVMSFVETYLIWWAVKISYVGKHFNHKQISRIKVKILITQYCILIIYFIKKNLFSSTQPIIQMTSFYKSIYEEGSVCWGRRQIEKKRKETMPFAARKILLTFQTNKAGFRVFNI